jgi:hypothetical protein
MVRQLTRPLALQAMTLGAPGQGLVLSKLAMPEPDAHDVCIKALACGVCRTDLHIVDGDRCLQRVAATLPGCARRAGDFVARFGGEAFALFLAGRCAG